MFEEIKKCYKNRIGKELNLGIKINLAEEQEKNIYNVASRVMIGDATDEIIYILGRIVYMNLLESGVIV